LFAAFGRIADRDSLLAATASPRRPERLPHLEGELLMPPFTSLFSARKRPTAPRRPALIALAAAAVAASVSLVGFAPSALAESTSATTYNRPSMTEVGGAEYLAWADKSANGAVHVAKLDSGGGINVQWTDPNTATYYGTGPTIASVGGVVVVAWTNLSDHHLWVGVPQGSGGANGSGAFCEEDLTNAIDESIGVAQGFSYPGDASSDATPYLTSEGDDGSGSLFLTWVDDAGNNMHVTRLVPTSGGCGNWDLISNENIPTETSWDGPAMVVSGYGGTEHYWLMWAGNDSNHELNIAEYDTSWNRVGSKGTETTHATKTDMGGAFLTGSSSVFMSYCGTNGDVYYQEFSSPSGGPEVQEPDASCLPESFPVTISGVTHTFWAGGVGVNYDYSSKSMLLSWADKSSSLVQIATI
jgi:hypothetical protein